MRGLSTGIAVAAGSGRCPSCPDCAPVLHCPAVTCGSPVSHSGPGWVFIGLLAAAAFAAGCAVQRLARARDPAAAAGSFSDVSFGVPLLPTKGRARGTFLNDGN